MLAGNEENFHRTPQQNEQQKICSGLAYWEYLNQYWGQS